LIHTPLLSYFIYQYIDYINTYWFIDNSLLFDSFHDATLHYITPLYYYDINIDIIDDDYINIYSLHIYHYIIIYYYIHYIINITYISFNIDHYIFNIIFIDILIYIEQYILSLILTLDINNRIYFFIFSLHYYIKTFNTLILIRHSHFHYLIYCITPLDIIDRHWHYIYLYYTLIITSIYYINNIFIIRLYYAIIATHHIFIIHAFH